MYTSQVDNGILNNYTVEPDTYYAVFPSPEQRRNYAIQGAIAAVFVSLLVLTSFAIS